MSVAGETRLSNSLTSLGSKEPFGGTSNKRRATNRPWVCGRPKIMGRNAVIVGWALLPFEQDRVYGMYA